MLGGWWAVIRAFLDWKVDYVFGCSAPFRWGFGAVKAGGVDLALRAMGGVWSACGVWWGVVGSYGRVLKSEAGEMVV